MTDNNEIEICVRCNKRELKENNQMIECFLCGRTICRINRVNRCSTIINTLSLNERNTQSSSLITVDIPNNTFDKQESKYICKRHIESTFRKLKKGSTTYRGSDRKKQLELLRIIIDKLLEEK